MGEIRNAIIASGSYEGDGGTTARHIYTGFQCRLVIIERVAAGSGHQKFIVASTSRSTLIRSNVDDNVVAEDGIVESWTAVKLDGTNGFIVADGHVAGNDDGITYRWVAFGY